jgi:2-polyprenyl-6-methoxyphenol hydroxylase-like FAD-dependent oxidoreductase
MVDVLVVGGGPVGMVTAFGLARAAGYHWSVLDGLARMGLMDDIETIALRAERYTYRTPP